jgi:hypothetical protein
MFDKVYDIPERFSHIFWSEWSTVKNTQTHGVSIAYRMLTHGDKEAWDWTFEHINNSDILSACDARGFDQNIKHYVESVINNHHA